MLDGWHMLGVERGRRTIEAAEILAGNAMTTRKPRPAETKAQLSEKLAAVLRDLMVEVDGKLVRAIPYEDAKGMTCDEIIEKFDFDHGIHHAIDGPHEHWNYTARMRASHRVKSAKIDIPQIAKTKRITAKEEAFRARLLAKATGEPVAPQRPKAKIKSRGFPPRQRPFR